MSRYRRTSKGNENCVSHILSDDFYLRRVFFLVGFLVIFWVPNSQQHVEMISARKSAAKPPTPSSPPKKQNNKTTTTKLKITTTKKHKKHTQKNTNPPPPKKKKKKTPKKPPTHKKKPTGTTPITTTTTNKRQKNYIYISYPISSPNQGHSFHEPVVQQWINEKIAIKHRNFDLM